MEEASTKASLGDDTRNIPQRRGNLGSGLHRTAEPVVFIVVWGSGHGKNAKLGGERQIGTIRASLTPAPTESYGRDLSNQNQNLKHGIEYVLDCGTGRAKDNGEVQRARLGSPVCDFPPEGDFVILSQFFDRFKRGRVLSNEDALLEEVRDVRHLPLLGEVFDTKNWALGIPAREFSILGKERVSYHTRHEDKVDKLCSDVPVEVGGTAASAAVLGGSHFSGSKRGTLRSYRILSISRLSSLPWSASNGVVTARNIIRSNRTTPVVLHACANVDRCFDRMLAFGTGCGRSETTPRVQ